MTYPKSTSNLSLSGPLFRNFKHFAETVRDVTLAADEALVNFNVSSLLTNVPIGEAVVVIQAERVVERTPLSSASYWMCSWDLLASVIMVNSMNRERVRPWAPPVSAVVANIYMESFEELALESALSRHQVMEVLCKWHMLHP